MTQGERNAAYRRATAAATVGDESPVLPWPQRAPFLLLLLLCLGACLLGLLLLLLGPLPHGSIDQVLEEIASRPAPLLGGGAGCGAGAATCTTDSTNAAGAISVGGRRRRVSERLCMVDAMRGLRLVLLRLVSRLSRRPLEE